MDLPALPAIGPAPPPALLRYARHRPETTLLYQLVERHYPDFLAALAERDRHLPAYVREEFEAYLKCGRLEHGFLRVWCSTCHAERLVAFSCKRRGFCPSCGARRMVESAALLVDEVLPREPVRQWVLSVPFPLRFLFAAEPAAMGEVLAIVWRALAGHLLKKAGLTRATGQTGGVTLVQRFGSALNLNIHFHMLCLDGAYGLEQGRPRFRRVPPPRTIELEALLARITDGIARHLEPRGLLVRDADGTGRGIEDAELREATGASRWSALDNWSRPSCVAPRRSCGEPHIYRNTLQARRRRRRPPSRPRAEPNSQTAAGTGTTASSM